jgi:hypothetical protein
LQYISLELTRTVDESTMYSNSHGAQLYIGFYPGLTSTAVNFATIARNQAFYKVDMLTFSKQQVNITIPNIDLPITSAGVDYVLNLTRLMGVGIFAKAPGEIVIGWSNTNNNASVVPLFNILVKYHMIFVERY